MRYTIRRECWNDKTYNGYVDNPYWRISFSFYEIGLTDDGKFWGINGSNLNLSTEFIKDTLKEIIGECKLRIKLV